MIPNNINPEIKIISFKKFGRRNKHQKVNSTWSCHHINKQD